MPQTKRLVPWPPLNISDVIQKLLFDLHCLTTTTLGCTQNVAAVPVLHLRLRVSCHLWKGLLHVW